MSLTEIRRGSTVRRNMDMEDALELVRRALEEGNRVTVYKNVSDMTIPNTFDVTVSKL